MYSHGKTFTALMTLLFATGMMLSSCGGNGDRAVIHRLDRQLSLGQMPSDSLSLNAARVLFAMSGYGELNESSLAQYASRPSITSHLHAVDSVFSDTDSESLALGHLFSRLHTLLPDIAVPQVYTIISPFTQSILMADSILFIGLNHYLGRGYPPYRYFPDYISRLKERPRIPLDVAEAIVRTAYPFLPSGNYPNAISRMAYEGAVIEAVMQLTGAGEAQALGYDDDGYAWLTDNEASLWKTLAERQLLFSTDPTVARSLVDPSPYVSVLSAGVPGRAGRYIGHRLVSSYLKNNRTATLSHLLSPDFYTSPSLLRQANYNPQ